MTCCPTRTSARATTAARSTRTAIPSRRSAAAASAAAATAAAPAMAAAAFAAAFEGFPGGGFEAAIRPICPTCSKACSAAPAAARRGRAQARLRRRPRAAEGRRRRLSPQGAVHRRRRRSQPQRVTLGSGRTIDLKLPKGRRGRRAHPACRAGPGRARRARRRDRHDRDRRPSLLRPRRRQYPPVAAGHAQGSGARRQGQGADPRGRGDADRPQGLVVGQGAAPQGPRLHRQGRQARRPAGPARGRPARGRCRARALRQRLERAAATRAPRSGFDARSGRNSFPIARGAAQAAGAGAARASATAWSSAGARARRRWSCSSASRIGVYEDGFVHAGNIAYMSLVALFPFLILAAAIAHLFGSGGEAPDCGGQHPRPPAARSARSARRADRRSARRALGQPAVVRRDRRPVDRGELHRDHPRHPAPRLWRQIFGQLLAVSARLDGRDRRRGGAAADRLRR